LDVEAEAEGVGLDFLEVDTVVSESNLKGVGRNKMCKMD
jgi:hypothetical protein